MPYKAFGDYQFLASVIIIDPIIELREITIKFWLAAFISKKIEAWSADAAKRK